MTKAFTLYRGFVKILLHFLNEIPLQSACLRLRNQKLIWKVYSQENKLVGQSTPFFETVEGGDQYGEGMDC
jgi:hypothetical protein